MSPKRGTPAPPTLCKRRLRNDLRAAARTRRKLNAKNPEPGALLSSPIGEAFTNIRHAGRSAEVESWPTQIRVRWILVVDHGSFASPTLCFPLPQRRDIIEPDVNRALVAQGIEQRFPKPRVAGSSPAGGTCQRDRSTAARDTDRMLAAPRRFILTLFRSLPIMAGSRVETRDGSRVSTSESRFQLESIDPDPVRTEVHSCNVISTCCGNYSSTSNDAG